MAQKNSQTHKVEVKNFKEIYDYCYLNEIVDVNSFIDKCLKQGFDIQKYGMLGSEPKVETEVKVVEKIVEVIKEIQLPPKEVEVIKYVDREVVKEIPVEKVVTKIEYISYKNEEDELLLKVEQLEEENKKLSTMIQETPKKMEDNSSDKIKMLQETLLKQKKELSLKTDKIKELEEKIKQLEEIKINQGAVFMKSSNLNQNI